MGRLTGCCGCFDLRGGARAIGITLLVLYCVALALCIVNTIDMVGSGHTTLRIVELFFQYVVSILGLIMNALLVYGVNKDRRGMILGWLIFSGIIFGLQTVSVVIYFIVFCIAHVWWAAGLMLGVAVLMGVIWYWFVVVLHYHENLKENNGVVHGRHGNHGEMREV